MPRKGRGKANSLLKRALPRCTARPKEVVCSRSQPGWSGHNAACRGERGVPEGKQASLCARCGAATRHGSPAASCGTQPSSQAMHSGVIRQATPSAMVPDAWSSNTSIPQDAPGLHNRTIPAPTVPMSPPLPATLYDLILRTVYSRPEIQCQQFRTALHRIDLCPWRRSPHGAIRIREPLSITENCAAGIVFPFLPAFLPPRHTTVTAQSIYRLLIVQAIFRTLIQSKSFCSGRLNTARTACNPFLNAYPFDSSC